MYDASIRMPVVRPEPVPEEPPPRKDRLVYDHGAMHVRERHGTVDDRKRQLLFYVSTSGGAVCEGPEQVRALAERLLAWAETPTKRRKGK